MEIKREWEIKDLSKAQLEYKLVILEELLVLYEKKDNLKKQYEIIRKWNYQLN